ncbi:MAG: glycosyltransferase family 4 protein, partial [Candidatus Nanohaloarchaea archaeon]
MKIAHVLTRFSPERNPGGVERVVEELAKRQAEDHEVEVVCRNEFDDPGEEDYEGFIVKRAGVADRSGLRTLSSLQSMRKLIRDSEADIYHIHDWSPYLNYYFSSEPGKSVLTLHNRAFNFFTRRLQDSCISRADRVTAVSGSIESRLDIDVKVVPDGVDTGSFVPLESGDYYLYAGNLIENKGIRELVSVWREEWPLMKVAGSGPLRDKLEDKENIEYLGEIPHQNMPELIGRSKGVILPSRSEGFG